MICEKVNNTKADEFVEASIKVHGMEDFNKKIDFLHSKNGFRRTFNDKPIAIPYSLAFIYKEALNSVLYFFILPYVLKDKGAIKTLKDIEKIKVVIYQKMEVNFTEKDGGVDFQDNFLYWINKKRKTLDYLAYLYHTNKGGVCFRVAISRRTMDGVVFQDYENYSVPKNTPLDELYKLYKKGELELFSMIESNSIRILKP